MQPCCAAETKIWNGPLALPISPQEKLSAGNQYLHPFPYLIYSGSVENSHACLCAWKASLMTRVVGGRSLDERGSWPFSPQVPAHLIVSQGDSRAMSKENAPMPGNIPHKTSILFLIQFVHHLRASTITTKFTNYLSPRQLLFAQDWGTLSQDSWGR